MSNKKTQLNKGTPRTNRILAAPKVQQTSNSIKGIDVDTHKDPSGFHEFAKLEAPQVITYERYCGPTPESNWVLPGLLLVGAYPASNDDNDTFDLISNILLLGVTKFVCLQKEVSEYI